MGTPQKGQPQFVFGSSSQHSSPLGQVAAYDLTNSDPALAVIIKGLQKRDSVTRARASDDLLNYLKDENSLAEEAAKTSFIKSWIGLYGSLAIDIDRKVRANSHTVLGLLVQKYQKKTVKFLPQVAALWLIGQHDNDRLVNRTAVEAFEAAFSAEAKRIEFIRLFADDIYAKCHEFVLVADASSLSDARFINTEDSQAKFNNVIGGAEQVLATLISNQVLDTSRQGALIRDTRLWKRLCTEDASLQSHGLKLLQVLLTDQVLAECHESIELHLGSLISKTSISNSSILTQSLITIAIHRPELLYVSKDSSKKAVPARLRKFIQHSTGPGVPEDYWGYMARLLELAPRRCEVNNECLAGLVDTFDKSSRQATRLQAISATTSFNKVCLAYMMAGSSHAKASYVDRFSAELSNNRNVLAYLASLETLYPTDRDLVLSILRTFSDQVLRTFDTEDETDSHLAYQWSEMMVELFASTGHKDNSILDLHREVVSSAMSIQDLSPSQYRFICKTLQASDTCALLSDTAFVEKLVKFTEDLPLQAFYNAEQTLQVVNRLVHMKESQFKPTAIINSLTEKDVSHEDVALALLHLLLDNYFKECAAPFHAWIASDLKTPRIIDDSRWNLYMSYLRKTGPDVTSISIIETLASIVLNDNSTTRATNLLELIAVHAVRLDRIEALDDDSIRRLVQSPWTMFACGTTASIAEALLPFFNSECPRMEAVARMEFSKSVIDVGQNSVTIHALCLVANELGSNVDLEKDTLAIQWHAALLEALPAVIPHDLSILHPIGILSQFVLHETDRAQIRFDSEGYSALTRLFLVRMGLRNKSSMNTTFELLVGLQLILAKTHNERASRAVSSQGKAIEMLSALTTETQTLVNEVADELQNSSGGSRSLVIDLARHSDRSPLAYYKALAFYEVACCIRERGVSIDSIGAIFHLCSDDLFISTSFSSACNEVLLSEKKATFQRNKLASDLSGKMKPERLLESLVKLIALVPQEPQLTEIMPRQRTIFLIKALLDYKQDHSISVTTVQQLLTLISRVIPAISKEYGSFWKMIIDWVIEILHGQLQSTFDLPLVYTNLKLVAWLTTNYENNDDLSEFWLTSRKQCEPLIVKTFIQCSSSATEDQASILCTLVASRLARAVPAAALDYRDRTSLSALICSNIEHIQLSAYALHVAASEQEREEMIMTSALAKEFDDIEVELPAELISIAVDCPLVDEDSIYDLPSPMPSALRGYCMAWILLFKFFEQSPMRMRLKLVDDLQRSDLIESLLAFIFLALKLLDTKPVDVSKISKSELDNTFENGQGELTSYASHLYYLALVYTPALVRSWWIECKDRLLTAAVENLTEKHYSISLIQRDVQTLQSKQSAELLKDDNLTINVSNAGRDIFTTYEIDDQKMEMAIRLPANYPLRRVVVEGLQRIGVKDAQWRAWLLASQAVLTAQNGTILDAVSLFQRNVSLHFEGVADCNICFSVLSVTDKSLPSKKCQTCKNLFHSSCLFKWFKSSSQSRCPLCRTSFAF